MSKTFKITKRFFRDHVERELSAPTVLKETKNYYYIDATENQAMSELRADAEYYAYPFVSTDWWGLISSARALLEVIGCSEQYRREKEMTR